MAGDPTTAIHCHAATLSKVWGTIRVSRTELSYLTSRRRCDCRAHDILIRTRRASRTTARSTPARLSTCSRHVGRPDARGQDVQDAKIQGWLAGGGGGQESPFESQKEQSEQGRSRAKILRPQDPEEETWQSWSRAVIIGPEEHAHKAIGIALKVQWHRNRILMKTRSQPALPKLNSRNTPVRIGGDGPDG
jgi:hypothetical protein